MPSRTAEMLAQFAMRQLPAERAALVLLGAQNDTIHRDGALAASNRPHSAVSPS